MRSLGERVRRAFGNVIVYVKGLQIMIYAPDMNLGDKASLATRLSLKTQSASGGVHDEAE